MCPYGSFMTSIEEWIVILPDRYILKNKTISYSHVQPDLIKTFELV